MSKEQEIKDLIEKEQKLNSRLNQVKGRNSASKESLKLEGITTVKELNTKIEEIENEIKSIDEDVISEEAEIKKVQIELDKVLNDVNS